LHEQWKRRIYIAPRRLLGKVYPSILFGFLVLCLSFFQPLIKEEIFPFLLVFVIELALTHYFLSRDCLSELNGKVLQRLGQKFGVVSGQIIQVRRVGADLLLQGPLVIIRHDLRAVHIVMCLEGFGVSSQNFLEVSLLSPNVLARRLRVQIHMKESVIMRLADLGVGFELWSLQLLVKGDPSSFNDVLGIGLLLLFDLSNHQP